MRTPALLLLVFLLSFSTNAQIFISEDATGNNDGSSWQHAYVDLSDALENAEEGDSLWIAFGEYKPPMQIDSSEIIKDTTHYFLLDKNLTILGGFAGFETNPDQRDILFNPTILSGDILDDDRTNLPEFNKTDNARHILVLTEAVDKSTIIDGLYIWRAYGAHAEGGGLKIAGSCVLRNTTIDECQASKGGAIWISGNGTNELLIENCTFIKNRAHHYSSSIFLDSMLNFSVSNSLFNDNADSTGGCIGLSNVIQADITNCSFARNQSIWSGVLSVESSNVNITATEFNQSFTFKSGATLNAHRGANMSFDSCSFDSGTADEEGGAMFITDNANIQVLNSTFQSDSADAGGAISLNDSANLSLNSCSFQLNFGDFGGVIISDGHLEIENCVFDNNAAEEGSVIVAADKQTKVSSSYFTNNHATGNGGAIAFENADFYIENCLFASNSADGMFGIGAIAFIDESELELVNNTFASNSGSLADNIAAEGAFDLYVANNIFSASTINMALANSGGEMISKGGNISDDQSGVTVLNHTSDLNDTDPLFSDPVAGDYRLSGASPCIDSAVDSLAPNKDINGKWRDALADRGAFEFDPLAIPYYEIPGSKIRLHQTIVDDLLGWDIEGNDHHEVRFTIISMNGHVLVKGSHQSKTHSINVNTLAAGTYLVHYRTTSGRTSKTFIKR
jgi:predicted outer membrane repeat protein